ncbi:TetR/AcrR family transcriptional regulator [Actinomadura verrucosospora]|uniref:TetR family transcriptional regulator n=1 Tax=Actinomadura verrucosospora TaxID=46165 RepID=A0A7D3VZ23_ACTVE|nr:TetR/AcrR family transcriptional regulator [Actinomadura verrucosospora]QKG26940.1 TetR family transcriptional regulator [Actinomadura verrucosospora]
MADDAAAGPQRASRGRGTPAHRTTADVTPTSSDALSRPSDTPGTRILVAAAVETMAEKGYNGTSVRDIADRAGMSPAVLYHYFGSKHDLLVAIMHRTIDHLIERCEAVLDAAPPDPARRLRRLVREHVLVHTELRREAVLGVGEMHSIEPRERALLIAKRDRHERMFHRLVNDGVASGAFGTPFPSEAVRGILTMATGVSVWFREDGPLTAAEVADRFGRLALALVEADPDA